MEFSPVTNKQPVDRNVGTPKVKSNWQRLLPCCTSRSCSALESQRDVDSFPPPKYCWWFRNPVNSPVDMQCGSLSHYLQGFSTIQNVVVWDFWTINSRTVFKMTQKWLRTCSTFSGSSESSISTLGWDRGYRDTQDFRKRLRKQAKLEGFPSVSKRLVVLGKGWLGRR